MNHQTRQQKTWLWVGGCGLVLLCVLAAAGLILFKSLSAGGPATATSTPPPSATPEVGDQPTRDPALTHLPESETPTEEAAQSRPETPTPPAPLLAEAQLGDLSPDEIYAGSFDFSYPLKMRPGDSETVALRIYLPGVQALQVVPTFTRVQPPEDQLISGLLTFTDSIYAARAMRAELYAGNNTLTIKSMQAPSGLQALTIAPNAEVYWYWIITAPNEPGRHVLFLQIFLGNATQQLRTLSFNVEVADPQPTPTASPLPEPAPTPVPLIEQVIRQVAGSIDAQICLAIPATLVAVLGLLEAFRRFSKKKRPATTKKK